MRTRAAATLLAAVLPLAGVTACSQELDTVQSLNTTLGTIDGVTESDVAGATVDRAARVDITLDRDLDAGSSLAVIRDVTRATDEAGLTGYVLRVRRSLIDDDVLVVDETFAHTKDARVVTDNWFRVTDALLGQVDYAYQVGNETIDVDSGGGIGHDVAEASRIGYGWSDTTWHFTADGATYVVSGRVEGRDSALFDRVQRTVSSTVLPVPATEWRLERRTTHVLLDLEVMIAGDDPRRISVRRWDDAIRPLAVAALRTTRYPDRTRWLLMSETLENGDRDTFASWSSGSPPVKGRDRWFRGWDQWWWELAKRI